MDDTQAQKKGTQSVGRALQRWGLTGDVRNCQTMVVLAYATDAGPHSSTGGCTCPRNGLRPRVVPRSGCQRRSASPPSRS
ncbi:hypothetical protein [Streptomyces sp. NPDC056707]|uniref:hypothetical protein n=1 Tax=Streptomyces sp. NPDC056707 TaxID=3345919 RepID=UPI00369AAFE7